MDGGLSTKKKIMSFMSLSGFRTRTRSSSKKVATKNTVSATDMTAKERETTTAAAEMTTAVSEMTSAPSGMTAAATDETIKIGESKSKEATLV